MAKISNFKVVPFNEPDYYFKKRKDKESEPPKGAKKNLSGMIDITLTTEESLYIGSGFIGTDTKNAYKSFLKCDGKAIIPGSSLKGSVKHISRIAASGCLDERRERDIEYDVENYDIKCDMDNRCIICDTFGGLFTKVKEKGARKGARKSKVVFGDLIAESPQYEIKNLEIQFKPSIKNPLCSEKIGNRYHLIGYKLYLGKCIKTEPVDVEPVETVKKGTKFKGKIFFDKLTDHELGMLCFALGIGSKGIYIKLGGYKSCGCGKVSIDGVLTVNGKKSNPDDYVNVYGNFVNDDVWESMDDVEDILGVK